MHAWYNGRFSAKPKQPVSVALFVQASNYNGFCRDRWGRDCSTPYGFYIAEERLIVMNVRTGLGTLTHELVHPIIEADFPEAPTWIDEGIASLYEQFGLPKPGEIRGYKNWRHPRLAKAMRSKKERGYARLDALFGMSDATFRGAREDLHYSMARYACQWLDERGQLWPFYHAWRDGYASDPSGERAFRKVTGKSPRELHDEWRRWVLSL